MQIISFLQPSYIGNMGNKPSMNFSLDYVLIFVGRKLILITLGPLSLVIKEIIDS